MLVSIDVSAFDFIKPAATYGDNIRDRLWESVDIKQNFTVERYRTHYYSVLMPVVFAILLYAWNFPTREFRLVKYLQRSL